MNATFYPWGVIIFFVGGQRPTLNMMHKFGYGVRVKRTAAIHIFVEAVVFIPLIAAV